MGLDEQIKTCSYHYQKWKALALSSKNSEESRKCLERAFFWIELQTAFITLFAMEKIGKEDPNIRSKIISAKANLSKRLVEYAREILKDL
ncbi:MAG: hypothetical protein QXX38_00285 [Candidatus Aenigmatarchaeota archaeon]